MKSPYPQGSKTKLELPNLETMVNKKLFFPLSKKY